MNRFSLIIATVAVIAVGCGGSDGGANPESTLQERTDDTAAPADIDSTPQRSDAASGSGTDGGFELDASGNVVNPCAVLTEQQVATATGLVVIGSEDQGNVGCRWFVERVDPDMLAEDAISWQPFRAGQFGPQKDAVDQGLQGEQIPDLGNDALYLGPPAIGEVWVLIDDLSFRVGNQFAVTNYDGRPAQIGLARAIVDALG